jgi:stress-induced morphogen
MEPMQLRQRLQQHFPDLKCHIVDLTGTKDHYELHIATESFRGKTPLAAHRLVYAALGSDVGQAIHALSIKTYLPEDSTKAMLAGG